MVRIDDRLVRVLQYWQPGEEWRDIFTSDPDANVAVAQGSDCSPGMNASTAPARVIDLEPYRLRRKRRAPH